MKNKRIRCHISIILENCWKVLAVLFVIMLNNIQNAIKLIKEVDSWRQSVWLLLVTRTNPYI